MCRANNVSSWQHTSNCRLPVHTFLQQLHSVQQYLLIILMTSTVHEAAQSLFSHTYNNFGKQARRKDLR